MESIDKLSGRSNWVILATAVCLVALLGALDALTGTDLSLSIFYLLPIGFATWFRGRIEGIFVSTISALTLSVLNYLAGENYIQNFISYWNIVVHYGFFLTTTLLLSSLKSRLEYEKKLARTDPLTNIANRRYFYDLSVTEIIRAFRYHHPFTVVYLDIDDFKQINDLFGHLVGDTVLRTLAQAIRNNLRSIDIVARLGGDEFIILLPETDDEAARNFFARLGVLLDETVQENHWPLKCSIGAITYKTPPSSVDEILSRVDQLMYSAKVAGSQKIMHEVHQGG